MSEDAARVRPGSGRMFDRIARRYDLLNRVSSLGLDRRWRRRLVARVSAAAPERVLDVAAGTADVMIGLLRANPGCRVVGLDPSAKMVDIGRIKLARVGLAARADCVLGDGQALPFAEGVFDACTIAFGIRNVPDRRLGLQELARVTRPGGKVAVLELAEPAGGGWGRLARLHVRRVVPRLGAWLSGAKEYRYLQQSVAAFPRPEAFAALMREAGLEGVGWERLSFGAAYLYLGRVPG